MLCAAVLSASLGVVHIAPAQAPLRYVNDQTTVEEVSFRFTDHQTFDTDQLRKQIVTTAPGTFVRLKNTFSFIPGIRNRRFPFDPVTLQKDVVRLRRFYRENGFPDPHIDYPASQLDTTDNQIHVIFSIREGPFLTIRSADVRTAEDTSALETVLDPKNQVRWTAFRQQEMRLQGRYTDAKRTRIENQIQSWFRDRGFAFAEVRSVAKIDTSQNAVDLRFLVDQGPQALVSEIRIDGAPSVSPSIIRRELPFTVGDRFSAQKVRDGQRQLFNLDLLRVALADLPEQPQDSTVVVRYRVRESKLRSLSGQVGYGTQSGVTLEGNWRHRNFYGNARTLIVGLTADTGYPENPPNFLPNFLTRSSSQELNRQFRAEATLRQPYLFTDRLSGSVAPFFQERLNPAFAPNPDRRLDLNEREYGITSTFVFDTLPYRPVSLQYSFSRTRQFLTEGTQVEDQPVLSPEDDLFNRSIFSLNGTFGRANDYVNPTEGYIFRPTFQIGGIPFESGVEFARASLEVSGYLPLSDHVELAGRLSGGALWPFSESLDNLKLPASPSTQELQQNRIYQNRFSDYLFYAGGGSDVRGWAARLAGGKVLRESPRLQEKYVYRPIGARTKVGVNLEARFPLPGLGANWRTAAFIDGAYLTSGALTLTPSASVPKIVQGPDGTVVGTDPSQVLVGSGVGVRYNTSFGFLRIDIAYKLTPDRLDLRSASTVGARIEKNKPLPPPRFIRRLRLHFGIGRSF